MSAYRCPSCGTSDPLGYVRCNQSSCPDGRDPRPQSDAEVDHLRAQVASLQKELAERTAERDAALSEVDDLQSQAEVVAEEFEKDCWKAMRSLLSSCNFNWQDVEDGVTADDAREYISTTLDELEKGEQRWKARADTLARRVEGLEADNERLTKERDRERKHVARLMRDLQHNRERAEKAEAIIRAAPLIQTALTHASFALDGIVALDDEDMGKDGGSATCQQAKHTVDRALAALKQKDGGNG